MRSRSIRDDTRKHSRLPITPLIFDHTSSFSLITTTVLSKKKPTTTGGATGWTGWATDHLVDLAQSVVPLSIRPWTLLGWPMCFCCRISIEPEKEVQATSPSPRPAPCSSDEFWLQPSKIVLDVSTICICSSWAAAGHPARRQTQRQG
jgi:hypothetical protein